MGLVHSTSCRSVVFPVLALGAALFIACAVGTEADDIEQFSVPTEAEGEAGAKPPYESPDSIPGSSTNSGSGTTIPMMDASTRSSDAAVDAAREASVDASVSLPDATTVVDAAPPILDAAADDSGATYIGAATWSTNATAHRCFRLQRYAYDCPAGGTNGTVWGSAIYSDDSSICTAAVHDGKITTASGGRITIEMRPGENIYRSSTRNGVTTTAYTVPTGSPSWPCSYVLYPW